MSEVVGRVRFVTILDGSGNKKQAERIGKEAGAAQAKAHDKAFEQGFRDSLTKAGRRAYDEWDRGGRQAGRTYSKGLSDRLDDFVKKSRNAAQEAARAFYAIRLDPGFLDDFAKGFDDAEQAVERLRGQMDLLEQTTDINRNALRGARNDIDAWAEAQERATQRSQEHRENLDGLGELIRRQANEYAISQAEQEHADNRRREALNAFSRDMEEHFRKLRQAENDAILISRAHEKALQSKRVEIDKHSTSVKTLTERWRSLGHNTRQWTLIISAVMAAMEDLAVLSSAVGGGIIALGGAATSGVAGVGALAAAFVTLNKDLDELPPHLRDVAREFKNFTPVFGELREAVAGGAFPEMQGSFDRLGRSLRSLSPELNALGHTAGAVWNDFTRGTQRGSDGLEEIRRALVLANTNFRNLSNAAGTFALAFLRSFNRAQPLVETTIGYVDKLANRFDAFTRSNAFDDWMRNSEITWNRFGQLLDATGRALNNLVTPASVARTAHFLESLTSFMPNLGKFLEMLGRLDLFGILAAALDQLGQALEPLGPAFMDLATAWASVAHAVLPALAGAIEGVARLIAPLVQSAADLVNSLPPEAFHAIAVGVLAVGSAFVVLKASMGIATLIGNITRFSNAAAEATTITGRFGNSIKGALSKAGLVGVAVAGSALLVEAVKSVAREMSGVEEKSREFVATGGDLSDIFRELNSDVSGSLVGSFDNLGGAISRLPEVGSGVLGVFQNIGLAFDESGAQALALAGTLGELDAPLTELANVSVQDAVTKFSAWATEMGATDEQVAAMLEKMPGFSEALRGAALASGEMATQQDLVDMAMGRAADTADRTSESLAGVGSRASESQQKIKDFADEIKNFADQTLNSRSAARDYEQSLADLTAEITENGAVLDIATQEGRDNEAAIDDLVQSTLNLAAETLKQTGNQEKANEVIRKGRDDLANIMTQFGMTAEEARKYAERLGLTPDIVATKVRLDGVAAAEQALGHLVRRREAVIYAAVGGWNGSSSYLPNAAGSILNGPTKILAGEAGREAIVPLDRPLDRVNPEVRWLSAIAQGKATPAMAGGGMVGGGGANVNIEAGAITVAGVLNPDAAAVGVVNRIVERVGG